MPFPDPHPGLVISYSYLWQDENAQGREEGAKNRPCAIVLARRIAADVTIVSVLPITHTPPKDPEAALELPPGLKAHLGLDEMRSWIVVSELNDFVWPGPDLRPVPGRKPPRFDYGVIPPSFFRKIQEKLFERLARKQTEIVHRSE